jgi:cytosine/adenosine deaminase-related metal-dependent hydrolase
VNAPDRLVIEGCAIATVDAAGTEYPSGYLVVGGGRILALGAGSCPNELGPAELVDGTGCLATPGLVNCHHHLYQWLTRGLAQQATLFEWLTELYPVWARLDVELEAAAAGAALAALLTSGCSTPATTTTCSRRAAATCSPPRWRRPPGSASASTRAGARWTSAAPAGACHPTRWSRTWTR